MPPPTNRTHPAGTDPLDQLEALLPSQVQTPEKTAFLHTSTRDIQQALTRLSAKAPRFRSTGVSRLGVQQNGIEEELLVADSLGAL